MKGLNKIVSLLLGAWILTGCESVQFSSYTAPRVTGRVLAAGSRQPLAGATVRRVVPVTSAGEATPPKGGQLLMLPAPARTDADGRFVLPSERAIVWFHHGGWSSVTVVFAHPGYENFQTNYNVGDFSARSEDDEPLVNAGDVLLQPVSPANTPSGRGPP